MEAGTVHGRMHIRTMNGTTIANAELRCYEAAEYAGRGDTACGLLMGGRLALRMFQEAADHAGRGNIACGWRCQAK